jgi:hypothetical protein
LKQGEIMKSFFVTAVVCLVVSGPAFAMSDVECQAMWKQADTDSNGVLNGSEANRYLAMMRTANKSMGADAAINEAIFVENCKADIFKVANIDAGAPLEGANSFTEEQAKDRILAAGLDLPSALTKDEKGIWRGTATKNGSSVKVAVDYKGNVVSE